MLLEHAAKLMALVLLTGSVRVSFGAADYPSTNPSSTPARIAAPTPTNRGPRISFPDLPVVKINLLTRELVEMRTNPWVRIQGAVLDQAMGDYLILHDDSGSIRAETRQTTPIGGAERVTVWGRLSWNGHQLYLRDAFYRPLSWEAISDQRIAPAAGKPDELPILNQVRQIRDLTANHAAWQYPVQIRGVITTTHWLSRRQLFVQDDTAGIFVSAQALEPDVWRVGDVVEISGVSGPGDYAPIIEAHSITRIGKGELPQARLVTLYQMASGQFDAQWVEVRGVVRSVRTNVSYTLLEISDINGLVEVNLPRDNALTNLVDSAVRVRGVCGTRAGPNRQLLTAYVLSPGTNWLTIEEAGIPDPFTLPSKSIGSLAQFGQWRAIQHRVKIAGVVTFSQPGCPMFVQDDSGGVPVYLSEPTQFQPGDKLEVAGYLSPGDFGYVFRNASCRRVGRGEIPSPKSVPAVSLIDQNLHGVWVEVIARLLSTSQRGSEDALTLQADNFIFEALRPAGSELPPVGGVIRLQGVYSILGDELRLPRALRLYTPASVPIQLVSKPSWWTGRNTFMVLSIMLATLVSAALWAITLRRRVAEQMLVIKERLARESALEQRYREIFDCANDLIFTFDLNGRLTSLNPAGQRVLGYAPDELLGLNIEQMLAPASRRLLPQLLNSKCPNGGTATFECELMTRDGRSLMLEASTRLMLKDGKVHSVQAIARDIAERKRVEESLRASEAHYRQLVEMSPVAIYIQSGGRFAFINKAGLKLFGAASPSDILGKRIIDFIHEDYREIVMKRVQLMREKGEPIPPLEEKFYRLDRSIVNVEVAAAPVVFDGQPATQVIVNDITERKRNEEELFNSRQMLRSVLDTIPQRVFWKDRNCVFLGCNKPLAEDCGFADPAGLVGKTDYDTQVSATADRYRADDQQVMESNLPKLNYEEPQIRTDGTQLWLRTSKVPLHGKDGQVIGVLGTYEDITERKRAETALAEASALLETLLEHIPDCIYFKDRQSRFVRYSKSFEQLFNVQDTSQLKGKRDFDFFTEEHARPAYEDEQEIIRSGRPLIGKLEKETHQDGRVTWALTTKVPWRDKDGNIIGTFGISKDITSIKEAEAELAYERELLRALLDTFPDSIYFKDRQSRFVRVSRSKAQKTLEMARKLYAEQHPAEAAKCWPPHLADDNAFGKYLLGKTDLDTFQEAPARIALDEEQAIMDTGEPIIGKLEHAVYPGKWFLVTKLPWRNREGEIIGTFGVSRDITPLKEAESKLQEAHERLVETSRLAGMAEVATDVLHNVGNVLNSVNVSCSLSLDCIRSSKISSLFKVCSLLQENSGRLAEFFTQDPRGRQVPEFLSALADHLRGEQTLLLKEIQQLVSHIDHIKQIVAMQQTYAKVAGVLEPVNPVQLVEDALHINGAALLRHDVKVQRDYAETPQIVTEKHKVLQILVNLIRNAKYAMDDGKRMDKELIIQVDAPADDKIRIQVKDNGIGIPQENLTRIFSHGFTTRRNGHGFGLHSSALAVKELGGSLQAHSDGPNTGATFTLLLPLHAPKHSQPEV